MFFSSDTNTIFISLYPGTDTYKINLRPGGRTRKRLHNFLDEVERTRSEGFFIPFLIHIPEIIHIFTSSEFPKYNHVNKIHKYTFAMAVGIRKRPAGFLGSPDTPKAKVLFLILWLTIILKPNGKRLNGITVHPFPGRNLNCHLLKSVTLPYSPSH